MIEEHVKGIIEMDEEEVNEMLNIELLDKLKKILK